MAKFFFLLTFLVFSIGYYYLVSDFTKENVAILLLVAGLSLAIFSFKKESVNYLRRQYLKHSTLVLVGFVIVHYQYHIDFLLGNVTNNLPYIWVDTSIVIKALSCATAGLICFMLGYLAFNKKITLVTGKSKISQPLSFNVLIVVAVLLLLGYFYYANPLYLLGFYGAEALGAEANYIILLFKVVVFAALIQQARNFKYKNEFFSSFVSYLKKSNIYLNILIGIYLTSVIISGDRGPLIFFLIAYYANYLFVSNKKLNILKTVGLLAVGILFISTLGIVRSMDRDTSFRDRLKESMNVESRFETKSIIPQTQELAASIRSLHHTMSYVPIHHDYLYGRFQFQQAMSMIPFGNSFVHLIFTDNSYKYTGSSRFITWINQGDNPYTGDGSSVTADFYFDFGLFGVLLGMFIFGYLMRYAELIMYSNYLPSLFGHAFFIGYLSSAIFISRSTFLVEMKLVVWIFFVLWINKFIINRK